MPLDEIAGAVQLPSDLDVPSAPIWLYSVGTQEGEVLAAVSGEAAGGDVLSEEVTVIGPSGPGGITARRVGSDANSPIVLSRQDLPDALTRELAQLEGRGLPGVRLVASAPSSPVPGLGSVPISPAAKGFVISYQAQRSDISVDQQAVVVGTYAACDHLNVLDLYRWWYGDGAIVESASDSLVVTYPSLAGNGTTYLRYSVNSRQVTVIASIGLPDDETVNVQASLREATDAEWKQIIDGHG